MSFTAKEIKKLSGKAISAHQMVEDGDRILVAVSGGRDSLSLLWSLRERIRRIPIDYYLVAVHVELGFRQETGRQMEDFFTRNNFNYSIIRSRFGVIAHSEINRENPCFLCSRLKRKALFEKAAELNCNKIAFGHHKDDFIETFFLNLLYSGSTDTIKPVQELFNGKLTIIRPFYLLSEKLIRKYAAELKLQAIDSGCPSAETSKRKYIRTLLAELYRTNKKIKGNIFHGLKL